MNYFLIHGSYGNPYKNWFPWLKEELSVRKKTYLVPHFPSFEKQNYFHWSTILESYLKAGCITEDTIFITHSLGGIFLVKFLLENQLKVKKLILVSAFNNTVFSEDNSLYDSFYIEDSRLEELRKYCGETLCIYSDNDPYVSENSATNFADKIGAEKLLIEGAGHFTGKNGYFEFPQLLNYL